MFVSLSYSFQIKIVFSLKTNNTWEQSLSKVFSVIGKTFIFNFTIFYF
jgi:hypothetical protein